VVGDDAENPKAATPLELTSREGKYVNAPGAMPWPSIAPWPASVGTLIPLALNLNQ
jgi:hypothetical protein